jgi:hypothetical protein
LGMRAVRWREPPTAAKAARQPKRSRDFNGQLLTANR